MKAFELLSESKTKKVEPTKPRNFVAKNAVQSGAGAHKDKKKAAKQGDVKHRQKVVDEADSGNKIQQLEASLAQLEQLMPAVMQLQKNHYEFEAIEDEITSLTDSVSQLGDKSAVTDLQDAMQTAIENIRRANGAVYEIEKTLKGLIKHTNYSLDDARDEEQYESRFGGEASVQERSEKKLK